MEKKIVFFRKREFWGGGINVTIFVNNNKYILPPNSKIAINSNEDAIFIKAKYLWLASKEIKLNGAENNFEIKVNQIITDLYFFTLLLTILFLFVLSYFFENIFFNNLLLIVGISFLSYMFFYLTLGSKNYFNFNINGK